MRNNLFKLILLLTLVLASVAGWATVNEYSFTATNGTFAEISGGTIHGTSANDNESFMAVPIGFNFTYNGQVWTEVSINTNGFIAMGATVASSYLALSTATGTNNVIAIMNRDLISRADGEIMTLTTGTAPNRVFTVQWKHYRRYPTTATNDDWTFQIKLAEAGNAVSLAYGTVTAVTVSTAQTLQVGLRGDDTTDYSNRSTTTDWTATTAGTIVTASCRISATVFPTSGLTFTWAPPVTGTPPLAAQNPMPADNAINANIMANLSWVSGGGVVDAYYVYFGTDNPPTNIVNGSSQTADMYDPADPLTYNTTYYWQVVPYNTYGMAANCPVWQFTTMADPTISAFPYNQNFDNATVPFLPLGWSQLNTNADTYTWGTIASNSSSTPNAARIRYNATAAMDDWMITPPIQLIADATYRISFKYRAGNAARPEKLSLMMGTAGNAAALTQEIFSNTNITSTTYIPFQFLFNSVAAQTVYLGFHGFSAMNMDYIYVDDFSIEEITESWDPPTNLAASVEASTVHLTWEAPGAVPPPPAGFSDGFETYADFSTTFAPWTGVDVDQSATYGFTGITFPNSGTAMSYIVFNPSATTPAVTGAETHTGAKYAACFAATTPPNNDWLISPSIQVTATDNTLKFWARSFVADYGLERFKVGVSTTGTAPANFTIISGATYVSAPVAWTEYTYSLAAYQGQSVMIGIQCLSNDAFILLVDDFSVGAPAAMSYEPVIAVQTVPTVSRSLVTPNPVTIQNNNVTRDLMGYKVYRDGAFLADVTGATNLMFDDANLAPATYNYTVTAVYTAGESVPAGPVSATVLPFMAPPVDLTATVDGNDVTIGWTSPEGPIEGDWLSWIVGDDSANSVGTNAVANFDVAHRFEAADLTAYAGQTITQIKFLPAYENCIYTVKVWTGGSATNAGTLVTSQVVTAPTINEWNLAILNTPVPIPATGELWFGYNINTQGGYPGGCDAGPAVGGKGNMIYFNSAWQPLTALAATLNYNWSIKAFAQEGVVAKNAPQPIVMEDYSRSFNSGVLASAPIVRSKSPQRAITGFKVFRDGTLLSTITDPAVSSYIDMELPNGTYTYGVSAVYNNGESDPATIEAVVNVQYAETIFSDGFETYEDFALAFAPWTVRDIDLAPTYGITDVTFPNSEGPMAFIVFNPSMTTPPLTTLTTHGGDKMLASFAATIPPNNDWVIAPRFHLGTDSAIRFYAKSHTAQYGLERFRVGVSTLTSTIPAGFQYVSGPEYVEAPLNWTEFTYDLSAYDGQNVWIGIRCVSDDAFIFYVDDFTVHSNGGTIVANDDNSVPTIVTTLNGNYPNPFNPETNISFSVKEATPVTIEIYNVKGQAVKTLVSETKAAGNHNVVWNGKDNNGRNVTSGVYFYKMHAGSYSSTRKMILMK